MISANRTLLDQLRSSASSVQVRAECVVVSDASTGDPGLFVPKRGQNPNTIFLRTGRDDLDTAFTLCHELGHFWAYATGRRSREYESALRQQQKWESTIAAKARNHPTVLAYPRVSDVPTDIY